MTRPAGVTLAVGAAAALGQRGWVLGLPAARPTPAAGQVLVLFEDGRPLGPADALHAEIAARGGGRYSVWGDWLYFSSSDGSDPRSNGRRYELAADKDPRLLATLARAAPALSAARQAEVAACLEVTLDAGQTVAVEELDRLVPLAGLDVLEVGCGQCWSAPFFLGAGARSYHGVELIGPLPERRIFDRRHAQASWTAEHYLPTPLGLPELLAAFADVTYTNADFGDTRLPAGCCDVVLMRVVSEHLLEPRRCFTEIHRLLRPGGRLYVSHGSYQSWNGHHVVPHNLDELDEGDPRQAAVIDWRHLDRLVENDRTDGHNLNYIRVTELMGLLRSLFEVESWSLLPTAPACGGERLSEARRQELPEHAREELLSDMLYVVVRKVPGLPLEPPHASGDPPSLSVDELLGAGSHRLLKRWLEAGGDTLAVSRATGLPPWQLVELRERLRRRRDEESAVPQPGSGS